jgi:hypothetical protein
MSYPTLKIHDMRLRLLPFLTSALLLGSFSATSQVTMTQDDLPPITSDYLDSVWTVEQNLPAFPEEGPDRIWDYSNMPISELTVDTLFDADGDPAFPAADFYVNNPLEFPINGFEYDVPSRQYYARDENGWYRAGRSFGSQTLPFLCFYS